MSVWNRLFPRKESSKRSNALAGATPIPATSDRQPSSTAAAVTISGSGDKKPNDRGRLLEIGIQALKESLVVAEITCKDKAAAQDLVADEAKLTVALALGEASGDITGDNCLEALRAFRRRDYKIVERGKAEFVVEFIGMHLVADEPIEDTILAEIEDRIYLCMASQLLARLAAGRGKPDASEQLSEFVRDKLDTVAGRVMPKYGLSQEQFGELFVKAYRRCLNRPARGARFHGQQNGTAAADARTTQEQRTPEAKTTPAPQSPRPTAPPPPVQRSAAEIRQRVTEQCKLCVRCKEWDFRPSWSGVGQKRWDSGLCPRCTARLVSVAEYRRAYPSMDPRLREILGPKLDAIEKRMRGV
jgi:hypothetical protein